jgi:hypothetical protein
VACRLLVRRNPVCLASYLASSSPLGCDVRDSGGGVDAWRAPKIIGAVSTVASEVVRALTCSLTSCDATESLGAASLIHASEWQHFRFRIRAIQHIAIFDSSDPISCNNGTRSFDGPARSALGVVLRGQICLPVSRLISTCSTVRGSYIRSRKPVRLS